MRRISIDNIDLKKIDVDNNLGFDDKVEDFNFMLGVISELNALEFFDISYDTNKRIVTMPNNFNFKRAITILDDYATIVEETDIEYALESYAQLSPEVKKALKNKKAVRYAMHTYPARVGMVESLDYAYSYVHLILTILEEHIKQTKR